MSPKSYATTSMNNDSVDTESLTCNNGASAKAGF